MVCRRIIALAAGIPGGILLAAGISAVALPLLHHKLKKEEKRLEEWNERQRKGGEQTVVTKTNPTTGQTATETLSAGQTSTIPAGHTAEVVTTGGAAGTVTQTVVAKPAEQVVTTAAQPAHTVTSTAV